MMCRAAARSGRYGLTLSMIPAHTVATWGGVKRVPPAFAYTSPIGGTATAHGIQTNGTMMDDGEWHEVALSHFWANRTTNLFMDGEMVGQLGAERASPTLFTLSATTAEGTMTSDLHIYRSALNSDEVASLWQGNTYQSSLEVWAPLAGGAEPPTTNRAQSMAVLHAA